MDFFQNTSFKERNNMAGAINLWITMNLYDKQCLALIKQNKKHSSNQVALITYTPRKKFFAAATFEGL